MVTERSMANLFRGKGFRLSVCMEVIDTARGLDVLLLLMF